LLLAAAAELLELVDAVVLLVGLDLAGVDLAVAVPVPVDIVVAAAPAEAGQEHVVDLLNKEVVRSVWNSLVTSFLCCLLVLDFCLFSKYLYFV
jgi:ABC-type sulfate transport system permease component